MAGLWFKFWASNFLTDGDVDALPDAAAVLLVKMRCLCCIEGACPVSPSEIARKTRTLDDTVWAMLPLLKTKFFERRGDLFFDLQQERDAALSARGKRGALAANSRRGTRSGGTSDATSDATSGGTSDAQKLEVRSKKTDGSPQVVGSVEGNTVVEPVETVEKSESVPTGTLSIESLKKKSESAFTPASSSELERRRQEQKQRLLEWQSQKQKQGTSNTKPEFKLA
jgi:hypothetical protein